MIFINVFERFKFCSFIYCSGILLTSKSFQYYLILSSNVSIHIFHSRTSDHLLFDLPRKEKKIVKKDKMCCYLSFLKYTIKQCRYIKKWYNLECVAPKLPYYQLLPISNILCPVKGKDFFCDGSCDVSQTSLQP